MNLAPFKLLLLTAATAINGYAPVLPDDSVNKDVLVTNRFSKGCLHTLMPSQPGDTEESSASINDKRVCNSDDPPDSTECESSPIQQLYPEIRVHQGNWDTGLLQAWIYQVLLMEVAGTPATVGLTTAETPTASFYADTPAWNVFSPVSYPYDAVARAGIQGDCSQLPDEPCVHMLPELWPGQRSEYESLVEQHEVEYPISSGVVGSSGPRVPLRTLQEHPDLGVWLGLAGNDKRMYLAEIFKRPVTWLEYCEQVSSTNCSSLSPNNKTLSNIDEAMDDSTLALRYPNPEELNLYFKEGVYHGHFRYTEQNNCTALPDTCTGHIVFPPCSWSIDLEALLYWNNITGLESNGPGLRSNGNTSSYNNADMIQIWKAANATSNHVMMHFFAPDPLTVEFDGTDYEMVPIRFPHVSRECWNYQIPEAAKCSADPVERRGNSSSAACGKEVQPLLRMMATSIREIHVNTRASEQSPALHFLQNVKIGVLDINEIIDHWLLLRDRHNGSGTAGDEIAEDLLLGSFAREAICTWVVNHLDSILEFVPEGYPKRIVMQSDYSSWLIVLAQVICLAVASTAFVAGLLCFKYRKTKVMRFSQPVFMELILLGFALVCIGAYLYCLEPSSAVCISSVWLVFFGYTIELTPVIVKTAAINKLVQSSRKQKRVNISPRMLFCRVAVPTTIIIAFLITWTVVDSPKAEVRLTPDPEDPSVILYDRQCLSLDHSLWRLIAYLWVGLLLIFAAVLAFQSRGVMRQVNESKSLSMMIYSHVLFLIIRGVLTIFFYLDEAPSSFVSSCFSIFYSLDMLFAMVIYIFPKIVNAMVNPEVHRPHFNESKISQSGKTQVESRSNDGNLRLLVCTANLGNAEPSSESLEAWIPPGGACSRVTPLKDGDDNVLDGAFDVIAIGMQEASWKSQGEQELRGSELSEDEILNAMEEVNTAQLRELIQDILGEAYFQVVDERRGQMRFHLWATGRAADSISDVKRSGANTGIGNVLANKGGIVTSFRYKRTRISFLTAHLAAHEGVSNYRARCDNIKAILREAKTSRVSKKLDVATSSHHTFIMGDLNFRTNFGDEKQHEEHVNRALELIKAEDYSGLYSFDELQAGLSKGELLCDFTTLPCNFPPTFKVERQLEFVYKQQRTPSYTDRILFKSGDGLSECLKPLAYEPCVDFITSDHKPVRGAFSITPNESMGTLEVNGEYHLEFKRMTGSKLASLRGSCNPYLMFLWDSDDISVEAASLTDKMRLLWKGRSWPRTPVVKGTVDPDWGEANITLHLKDCCVGSDQMLFVAAQDYDTVGYDECVGVFGLNVKELISLPEGDSEKTMSIDRSLLMEGRHAGNIRFCVTIRREIQHRRASLLRRASTHRRSGAWNS